MLDACEGWWGEESVTGLSLSRARARTHTHTHEQVRH